MIEHLITDNPGWKLRLKVNDCSRPAGLKHLMFTGEQYNDKGELTNTSTTFSNSSGKEVMKIPLGDEASVQINGKIKWNGEDLEERLERIESMLHIPTRDVILEEKYQKLKRLWGEYKSALEEYKTWERLKDSK